MYLLQKGYGQHGRGRREDIAHQKVRIARIDRSVDIAVSSLKAYIG